MFGGFRGTRQLETEGPYGAFEQAIERQLGDRIRADEAAGVLLWSALANVIWTHPDWKDHFHPDLENLSYKEEGVGYSFRAAGDLVAAIRRQGNYMDWYCSGNYAVVDPIIGEALAREGWKHKFYEKEADSD